MDINNQSSIHNMMCEQAPTFEGFDIRFPEDTPVVIPCLENALTIFAWQPNDSYVFQVLIYFFSTLIPASNTYSRTDETNILHVWEVRRKELDNPYHPTFRSIETCKQADAVIKQLDPIATYCGLAEIASMHLHGNPKSYLNHIEADYTIVNRGHDWILRCAFELNISRKWKTWLRLMHEKQPYKILDLPSHSIDEGEFIFLNTMWAAAEHDGFDAMIILIKFWLRQAMTIVEVWDVRLTVEGNQGGPMPPYAWCVGAYEKMWHRFRNDLRDPFSEYPYKLRQEMLREISYMRVFEECWRWVCLATQDSTAEDFDPYEVRVAVYNHVLTDVRNAFQPRNPSTADMLEETFGERNEHGGCQLLAESPIVNVNNLEDDLRERKSLCDGLCKEYYPGLPDMTQEEYDALYPDSDDEHNMESESEAEVDMLELELTEDVELEAYGRQIDIDQFTVWKRPAAGDFCTWCQTEIVLADSWLRRCVVPVTCSDAFHAGCLSGWINSASATSHQCPNCKVQMTSQKRPRRPVQ